MSSQSRTMLKKNKKKKKRPGSKKVTEEASSGTAVHGLTDLLSETCLPEQLSCSPSTTVPNGLTSDSDLAAVVKSYSYPPSLPMSMMPLLAASGKDGLLSQSSVYMDFDHCLLCRRPKDPRAQSNSPLPLSDEGATTSLDQLPLWVCSDCRRSVEVNEEARPLEPSCLPYLYMVDDGAGSSRDLVPNGLSSSVPGSNPNSPADLSPTSPPPDMTFSSLQSAHCSCIQCLDRQELTVAALAQESQLMQSMWMEVRHVIRCIYCEAGTTLADVRNSTLSTDKVDQLVERLLSADPQQLAIRVEAQARDYMVDEVWPRVKHQLSHGSAKDVVQLLLDEYTSLAAASVTLSEVLKPLENNQMKRFGVKWELLNQHLFNELVFSQPQLCERLPALTEEVRVEASVSDSASQLKERLEELVVSMEETRQQWEKCGQQMQDYLAREELSFTIDSDCWQMTSFSSLPGKGRDSNDQTLPDDDDLIGAGADGSETVWSTDATHWASEHLLREYLSTLLSGQNHPNLPSSEVVNGSLDSLTSGENQFAFTEAVRRLVQCLDSTDCPCPQCREQRLSSPGVDNASTTAVNGQTCSSSSVMSCSSSQTDLNHAVDHASLGGSGEWSGHGEEETSSCVGGQSSYSARHDTPSCSPEEAGDFPGAVLGTGAALPSGLGGAASVFSRLRNVNFDYLLQAAAARRFASGNDSSSCSSVESGHSCDVADSQVGPSIPLNSPAKKASSPCPGETHDTSPAVSHGILPHTITLPPTFGSFAACDDALNGLRGLCHSIDAHLPTVAQHNGTCAPVQLNGFHQAVSHMPGVSVGHSVQLPCNHAFTTSQSTSSTPASTALHRQSGGSDSGSSTSTCSPNFLGSSNSSSCSSSPASGSASPAVNTPSMSTLPTSSSMFQFKWDGHTPFHTPHSFPPNVLPNGKGTTSLGSTPSVEAGMLDGMQPLQMPVSVPVVPGCSVTSNPNVVLYGLPNLISPSHMPPPSSSADLQASAMQNFNQQFNMNKVFTYPGGAFPHANMASGSGLASGLRHPPPTNFDLSLLLNSSTSDKVGLASSSTQQTLYSPPAGQHLAYPSLPSNSAPLPSPHALGLTAGVSPLLPAGTGLPLPAAGLLCDAEDPPAEGTGGSDSAAPAVLSLSTSPSDVQAPLPAALGSESASSSTVASTLATQHVPPATVSTSQKICPCPKCQLAVSQAYASRDKAHHLSAQNTKLANPGICAANGSSATLLPPASSVPSSVANHPHGYCPLTTDSGTESNCSHTSADSHQTSIACSTAAPTSGTSTTTTSSSGRQTCHCAYCELFGYGAPPTTPISQSYVALREKLRQRLTSKRNNQKQQEQQEHADGENDTQPAPLQDERNLDELLLFINGCSAPTSSVTSTATTTASASKAATKRARKKQQKKAEKKGVDDKVCEQLDTNGDTDDQGQALAIEKTSSLPNGLPVSVSQVVVLNTKDIKPGEKQQKTKSKVDPVEKHKRQHYDVVNGLKHHEEQEQSQGQQRQHQQQPQQEQQLQQTQRQRKRQVSNSHGQEDHEPQVGLSQTHHAGEEENDHHREQHRQHNNKQQPHVQHQAQQHGSRSVPSKSAEASAKGSKKMRSKQQQQLEQQYARPALPQLSPWVQAAQNAAQRHSSTSEKPVEKARSSGKASSEQSPALSNGLLSEPAGDKETIDLPPGSLKAAVLYTPSPTKSDVEDIFKPREDHDLDDELDESDRVLESFKRFCIQSHEKTRPRMKVAVDMKQLLQASTQR